MKTQLNGFWAHITAIVLAVSCAAPAALAQEPSAVSAAAVSNAYILGAEDVLSIKVINADEIGAASYPIDLNGQIKLPIIGSVPAGGLAVTQLQNRLAERLQAYIKHPDVTVTVADFRSQPVSVLGAVRTPGTHQIQGRKTVIEVISEAGGLQPDAGDLIKIARRQEFGTIPLPGAGTDSTGQFSVAQLNIRSVMRAEDPAQNIIVKPFDVVTVPKADLIYVIGDVKKAGGFPLTERSTVSILEALSMAEGLGRTAGAKHAKILRATPGETARAEIPVDVTQILSGRTADVPLIPNDILFIPTSGSKVASTRAIEAMIQVATGVAIFAK